MEEGELTLKVICVKLPGNSGEEAVMDRLVFLFQEEVDALLTQDRCSLKVTREKRQHVEQNVGDYVVFILDDSELGRRVRGRMISKEENKDGGYVATYAAVSKIYVQLEDGTKHYA